MIVDLFPVVGRLRDLESALSSGRFMRLYSSISDVLVELQPGVEYPN